MADASVAIKDANGEIVSVDAFTPAGGDARQVVVLGDPAAANTVGVKNGALAVQENGPAGAVRTVVTASTTDKQLLTGSATAVAERVGFTVFNNSSAVLYLGLDAAPTSTTDFTVAIPAGGYYESPFGYRGTVRGVWAAANGSAVVTELTR